ncbi:MAG: tetratricopeptide repeat protein [Phycisphaerae bacterium]
MLGKAAAKSGNADEARSYFQRVIDTFPGSAQAKSAGQELGKLKK